MMRLRLATLALCLHPLACGSPSGAGDGAWASASAPGLDEPDTDDSGPTTGHADASSTDASSTASTSSTSSTSWSTGDASSEAQTTTTPDASSSSGDPLDLCPRVRVVVALGETLNVRPTPSTELTPLGALASGSIVDVLDLVAGEALEGNDQWYQIQSSNLDGYVWSGLVECTLDEPATDGFFLPLECGKSAKISQGNFGDFSHQNQSAYAFDFQLGHGTPLVAIADGTVVALYADTKPGDPCYDGGGKECNSATNFVTLLHDDGTTSVYGHLSTVQVGIGELVPRGLPVGLSGSTGWSTGPHAHVARQTACAFGWCQSIPVAFTDVAGDGVPKTGDTVTSNNCP